MVACHCGDIEADTLVIPDKKSNATIEESLLEYFNGLPVSRIKVDYPYSGDPYVTIPAEVLREKWQPIDKFI